MQIRNFASQKLALPNIERFRKAQRTREFKLKSILRNVMIDILGTRPTVWRKFLKLVSEELKLPVPKTLPKALPLQDICPHHTFEKISLEEMTDVILFAINEGPRYLSKQSTSHESRMRLYRQVDRVLNKHKKELAILISD